VPDRSTDYRINQTTLSVIYDSIARVSAEALVSSDDNYLSMGGGVSESILNAAGARLQEEARKHVPLKAGEVAVTSAGLLKAKYVFHTVMIDYDNMIFPDDSIVLRATERCLQLADTLQLRSIAFPALGTGVGQYPFQRAAEVMTRTITDRLSAGSTLEQVTICLFSRAGVKASDVNLFYERAAGLAAIAQEGKSLGLLMGDLEASIRRMGRTDLLDDVARLGVQLHDAGVVLERSGDSSDSLSEIEDRSRIGPISREAVEISNQVEKVTKDWSDKQAEATALRTNLQGLMTVLNVQHGNLNKLEIQKAKHGIDVPLIIENSIEEIEGEIARLEAQAEETRKKLAALEGSQPTE
jgi:O-acetyl-ADP-ribose deacetylase (regulator of RNase III)